MYWYVVICSQSDWVDYTIKIIVKQPFLSRYGIRWEANLVTPTSVELLS